VILNASGCLDPLVAPEVARTLDAVVTKTVTPLPREGNPPVRIAEADGAMLNSIGLANPGIDRFLAEVLPRLLELGPPVWVSVGGFAAADYASSCERLDGADVSALELNLSCPNVAAPEDEASAIVAAARAVTSKPLYAKLSPALPNVASVAVAAVEAGADGLSLVNTIRGLALDPGTRRPRLALGSGGASGPALRPLALHCVYTCARAVELPIVGMGGIASGRDVLDFVSAGASAVALGTVLFSDPLAPARVRAELVSELEARGHASVPRIRGTARESASPLASYPHLAT
jgi:dihydroorotate dehydrogenase (NAD+) catalytic subunit